MHTRAGGTAGRKGKGKEKGRGGAGSSAHQLAARLHQKGYSEHLSWLEAYLADEARDRTTDGTYVRTCTMYVRVYILFVIKNVQFIWFLNYREINPLRTAQFLLLKV